MKPSERYKKYIQKGLIHINMDVLPNKAQLVIIWEYAYLALV